METMKEKVRKVIAVLLVKEPFFGLLLKRTWIIFEKSELVAWTDGVRIYLGEPTLKLPEEELAGTLLHEIAHVVLKHVLRVQDLQKRYALPPELLNVIADAVANKYVLGTEAGKFLQKLQPITPEHIAALFGISDVERKSLEEVIAEIARKASAQTKKPGLKATIDGDLLPKTSSEADGADERSSNSSTCNGEESNSERNAGKKQASETSVLNEGDEGEGPDARLSPEDVERRVERKVADAFVVAKTARAAGTVPAALERLVEEILKPKVDWRRLLREKLRAFIGSDYLPSWHRLNKKLPGLRPGKKYIETNDIIALVDTSGSIDEKTLQQFLGEIFAIARATRRKVIVIAWDAKAYEPFEIRGYSDLHRVKIRGGGGTVIVPALRAAEKYLKSNTKIIILSDWGIADIDSALPWLKKNADRIIAVTTDAAPPPFLRTVKIDL